MDAKNLQPFISSHLEGGLVPMVYLSKTGKQVTGYNAEIIPLICDVYLKARDHKKLIASQQKLAHIAEVLVRSLSKIGIVALVDEATGYQEVRDKNELHRILGMYVRQEFLPWTKRFPDPFYEELFRLQDWAYNPLGKYPLTAVRLK